MSEPVVDEGAAAAEPAAPAPLEGPSAGARLRQAREAAGLHVATLAANLKVPVRKLEALEEDRFDLLPDAVFVRALASSVCRTLKADPQPVLDRLPQTTQPRLLQDNKGINAPFRSPSDGPSPSWLDQVTRPVALTVLALLLGALVLIFLPVAQRGYDTLNQPGRSDPVMPPPGAAAPDGDTRLAAVPAAGAGPAETAAMPVSAAGAVPTAPAVGLAPGSSVAPSVPATPPAPVAAATPATGAQTAPAPVPGNAIIVFRTRGPSWVQVTDAQGATVLRRLMGPGESAGASGALPLSVTVGDASQTEVQVRGKPFDLAPLARDSVARFEVK